MSPRMTYKDMPPEIYAALRHVEETVKKSGLPATLLHLIKIRASQLNGCGFCIDMHMKEALHAGEPLERLYLLSAWREAPHYSETERAVLKWTEAVTFPSQGNIPDASYEKLARHFDKSDIGKITLAIIAINSWNRMVLAIRTAPGSYRRPA